MSQASQASEATTSLSEQEASRKWSYEYIEDRKGLISVKSSQPFVFNTVFIFSEVQDDPNVIFFVSIEKPDILEINKDSIAFFCHLERDSTS